MQFTVEYTSNVQLGNKLFGPPTKEKQHADFISHYKENKLTTYEGGLISFAST